MPRVRLLAVLLLVSGLVPGQDVRPPESLHRLYKPGVLLLDRDGDGFPDGIRAKLVLAAEDPAVVAAAAEIAGRLGHETCALDGSPLAAGSGPEIRIATPEEGLHGGEVEVAGGRVLVRGGDGAQLLAAARALAGWIPRTPRGGNLEGIASWLQSHGGLAEGEGRVLFDRLRVGPEGGPWRELRVRVRAPAARVEAVAAALAAGDPPGDGAGFAGVQRLLVEVGDGTTYRKVREVTSGGEDTKHLDSVPLKAKPRRFGLQDLFSTKGLLLDGDGDLVPDGCAARVVPSGQPGSRAAVDVALRLALESAGLRMPLAALPDALDAEDIPGPLVLVGVRQPLVRHLLEAGRLELDPLRPGEAEVRLVLEAFGEQPAVILHGGDAAGLLKAGGLLLRRVPHLTDTRRGVPGLEDLATEVRRILAGVAPAGQAARVIREAGILLRHPDTDPGCRLQVAVEGLPAAPGVRDAVIRYWREALENPLERVVEADPREAGGRRAVLDLQETLPWEVDRVVALLGEDLLPRISAGARRVRVEVLVSEPQEQREALAKRIADGIREITGNDPEVRVLSAYKPGFSWLMEVVLPAIGRGRASKVEILAPLYTGRSAPRWATLNARARWFQELHPALELMADELGLPLDDGGITFGILPEKAPGDDGLPQVHYEARVWSRGRRDPQVMTFEPALRRIPFSRVFPDYEQVLLTTGRVRLWVDGERVLDRKVPTDLETVWEAWQLRVLKPLHDHIMDLGRGRPQEVAEPRFALLEGRVDISEADRPLEVGHERVSPSEALYEEMYFHTLWLVSRMGEAYTGKRLRFPGSVVPDVRVRPGRPPALKTGLDGRAAAAPGLRAQVPGGSPVYRRIPGVKLRPPRVVGLRLDPEGLLHVRVRVHCREDEDRWSEWVRRAPPDKVDEQVFAAETGVRIVEELARLRGLGAWREALAYPDVASLELELEAPKHRRRVRIDTDPQAWKAPVPPVSERPKAVVPSRQALASPEAATLLADLARIHGGLVTRAGRTYLGRDLWVLETGPTEAVHYSRHKLAAWKPVLLISAREHANEVSSTTYVLQFLRKALQDPRVLKGVTLVVQPVWNADGAAVAVGQARAHPDWMLHAGYLGALGENLSVGTNDRDPVYPEAHVRKELFRAHLPDILLNPHGYPTHEWVQPFSGYAAWVRGREPTTRNWWGVRGWFLQGFTWPDGEEYEDQRRAAHAVRDRIVDAVGEQDGLMELSREQAARYMRYGSLDPMVYRVPLIRGVQVNGPPFGSEPEEKSTNFALRHPKTMTFYGICEVPDETARDDYLEMISRGCRAFLSASVEHLLEGDARIETKVTVYRDGVVRVRARKRPVMPQQGGEDSR